MLCIFRYVELDRRSFLLGAGLPLLASAEATARNSVICNLPSSKTRRFAWTVDDGVSSTALKSYLSIAENYDQHITFFVTSSYSSWRKHSAQIQRLLAKGKIQLANHTNTHKDLTQVANSVIKKELLDCHNFILNEFGYDARPYFRPTYGNWDQRVLAVANDIGYSAAMKWAGTLGDTAYVPETDLLKLARTWILNGHIIVDHANKLKTGHEISGILDIIHSRGLHSVTLREAFGKNFK